MKKYIILIILYFLTNSIISQTYVHFHTSLGDFEARIHDDLQPITGGNFLSLVNSQFYDNVIFHRIINDFVIQGGDPTGTGNGGPGYAINDEFNAALSNITGSLAMANSGPNTGGSQFFINTVDNVYLDPDYPVFGTIVSGWDTIQNIEQVSVDSNNRPLSPVVMITVRVLNETCVADAPTNTNAGIILLGSTNLSWDYISQASYEVRIRESNSATWTTLNIYNTHLSLTGLSNTEYVAQVRSVCDGNVYSNWVTFENLPNFVLKSNSYIFEKNINIFSNDINLVINSTDNHLISKVKIFNLLGKEIFLKNYNKNNIRIAKSHLKNESIIIVKIELANGDFEYKKVLLK